MSKVVQLNAELLKQCSSEFKEFVKYLFDDCDTLSEDFAKHSMCNVKLLAEVCPDLAQELVDEFKLTNKPEELIGHWVIETTRDYSNGTDWDCVDEVTKVERVTEEVTKTVTYWKPISYVEQETTSTQK